jgi:pyruvate kinase
MKAITTIPPYAPFLEDLIKHPVVDGFRLNTVMPLKESLEDALCRLKEIAGEKPVWIDLKCRQLRVARGAYFNAPKNPIVLEVDGKQVVLDPSSPKAYGELRTPPWSVLELDHEIELDTTKPVKCYLNDGYQSAYIAKVDGNRLIMLDGPERIVGGGESINILDPSLKIKGYLTENDQKYIEAAKKAGIHTYMLSFVEQTSDISDVLSLDPEAEIVAKIESEKGLDFVRKDYAPLKSYVRLMAARGDLYVEVSRPHKILQATKDIVKADATAIAASRIFTSLRDGYLPSSSDLSDLAYLTEIGYNHVMVGDDICFKKKSLFSALNLIHAINQDYVPERDYALSTSSGSNDAELQA